MIPLVYMAFIDGNVWIRVIGRGSFQCSPCLKKIVQDQLVEGHHAFIIDLAECEQLDSTFMGTLTGIAQRFKNKKQGSLRVINVNNSNKELMENLGLDQLFPIHPITQGKELPPVTAEYSFSAINEVADISKTSAQESVRSAHEALVIANEANVKKFQSLLEIIRYTFHE